jgi:hypothetical protein
MKRAFIVLFVRYRLKSPFQHFIKGYKAFVA